MSQPTTGILLNSTAPSPPAGNQNVKPQSDGATPQQSITLYPQKATASLLGVVKPDGTTITVDGSGMISAAGLATATIFLDTTDNVTLWKMTIASGAPVFTKVTSGVGVSGILFADSTGLAIGMTISGGGPVYTVLSSGFGPSSLTFTDTVDGSSWSLSFSGAAPVFTLI
jgi:hypothetical protein